MLALLLVLAARDTAGYWQQQVAYRITASLDERSGVLSGRERISYVNRSPVTLHDFYVHQYLNAFRPGSRWAAADSAERRERFQHLKDPDRSEEHTSELQSQSNLVCRLLLEKKKKIEKSYNHSNTAPIPTR